MKTSNLIIGLIALGVGAYAVYYLFKGSLSSLLSPVTKAADTLTNPIVPGTGNVPDSLSPINYIFPVTAVPTIIDYLKNPVGGTGTPSISGGAALFPPLALWQASQNLWDMLTGQGAFATQNKTETYPFPHAEATTVTPSQQATALNQALTIMKNNPIPMSSQVTLVQKLLGTASSPTVTKAPVNTPDYGGITFPIVGQQPNGQYSVTQPGPSGNWVTTYVTEKPTTAIPTGNAVTPLPAPVASLVSATTSPLTGVSSVQQAITTVTAKKTSAIPVTTTPAVVTGKGAYNKPGGM